VAVAVEQQVLGLQVAVDDVVRVQVVEGEGDFGGVELGDGVGEALRLAQQAEQLAALNKVHDHVQVLRVLERAPQGDEEGVLDLLQHAALVVGVLDLLHLDDLGLLEHFDGVEALVVLALDEVHATEAAGAEGALDLKVGERVLALGDTRLVEGLRGELHGAILGVRGRAGGVGGVYQVLYAGRVVRGRLLGVRALARLRRRRLVLLLRRRLRLRVGRVHRVGRLVLRGRRRAGVRLLGRVVRLGLMQMERARGALRGRGRQRRRAIDGRGRAVEVVGALGVLRPLLLQEAEGRHRSGAEECVLLQPWRCLRCLVSWAAAGDAPTAAAALDEYAGPRSAGGRRGQQQLGRPVGERRTYACGSVVGAVAVGAGGAEGWGCAKGGVVGAGVRLV
jgi:hypothetical protein